MLLLVGGGASENEDSEDWLREDIEGRCELSPMVDMDDIGGDMGVVTLEDAHGLAVAAALGVADAHGLTAELCGLAIVDGAVVGCSGCEYWVC